MTRTQKRFFWSFALMGLALFSCNTTSNDGSNDDEEMGGSSPSDATGGKSSTGGRDSNLGGAPSSGGKNPSDNTGGKEPTTDTGGSQSAGGGAAGGTGGGAATNTGGSQPQSTGGNGQSAGCEGRGYLICEDFESTANGEVPGGWTRHGSESEVVADVANSGKRSLRLGAIPVWERRIYTDASILGSSHWGRIFYRVAEPVPDAFVHSTLVALTGVGPTVGESEYRVVDTVKRAIDFSVADQRGKHAFIYNVQIKGGDEFGEGTPFAYTFEEEWHCAEWYLDSKNQAYRFYLDGAELISFERGPGNFEDAEIPDEFEELRVGWINYQESPPGFTAWLDDLALHDERIGCDP